MQLKKIVVGVDFSAASRSAAEWVARHLAGEAELILVHSIELPTLPGFLSGLTPQPGELVETARQGAETRLRDLGRDFGVERLQTAVRVGRPSEQINAVAREMGADLIVVGQHGRGRGLGSMLGTTAERTIRLSAVPVLVARGLPAGPPQSVVVPVDESPTSRSVLAWGKHFADAFDADVKALYAISPLIHSRIRAVSTATREQHLQDELIRNAENWLRQRLEEAGYDGEDADVEVAVGEPGYEITAAAQRFDADLIIMGSHGAGALTPVLLGRVARAVLRGSTVPILVIKDESEAE